MATVDPVTTGEIEIGDDGGNGDGTPLRLTVDMAGPDDGELVVLLHGFPQTRYTWRAELPALAAAGYRAWAPDQRGYSPGARPSGIDPYGTDRLVADVLALADAAGVDRFHLVGHDWGGQVAWLTATDRAAGRAGADRVRSLAVLSRPHPTAFAAALTSDPAQADRSRHHRTFRDASATDRLAADGGARLRTLLANAEVPPDAIDAYLDTLGHRDALDAAINWYRAAARSGGLAAADVPACAVPTLYVWGDADASVGRAAAEGTEGHVDGPYRFVELTGIGHFVTDQDPDRFPPLLLDHLGRHPVA